MTSSDENDQGDPFLHLTLESIIAKTKIKTYDMEFDASLANLIVYHEQFIGKDNQQLRLLSAELNSPEEEDKKLVSLNFLHTSPSNPLFFSSMYNGIENKALLHLTKLKVTLQLEALLSILRFQDVLSRKLPKDILEDDSKKKQLLSPPEENKNFQRTISTVAKPVKKNGEKPGEMIVPRERVFCFRSSSNTNIENQSSFRRISRDHRFPSHTIIRHSSSRCKR